MRMSTASRWPLAIIIAASFLASAAQAQWTAPDATGNINNANSGNVGIGISPASAYKLDVNGVTRFQSLSVPGTATWVAGGTIQMIGYPTKVSFGNGQYIQDNAGANMAIFAGHNLAVTTSDGDIIMGAGTPGLFRVASNAVFVSSSVPGTSTAVAGGTIQLAGYPTKLAFGNGQFIQDNAGGNMRIFAGIDLAVDTAGGDISMTPGGASAFKVVGNANITGNVGIGTSTPTGKLEVADTSDITTFPNSPMTAFVADTRPAATPNTGAGIAFKAVYTSTGVPTTIGAVSAVKESIVDGNYAGALTFATRANGSGAESMERMRITSTGNVGIGITPNSNYKLDVAGSIHATGSITGATVINAVYQDIAEWVPARGAPPAGTVVILSPDGKNEVMASTHAYDTSVAGVVSAQPGIVLGVASEEKVQVATTGRVRVHVDAGTTGIRVGDLLVTSDKPGIAMKSIPLDLGGIAIHRPGTIIGKALEPVKGGVGEVLVLLSLQ